MVSSDPVSAPFTSRTLGRTGLRVGPLGIGASYGIASPDVEWAVDQGCNYLYWGSLRRPGFGKALRNLARTRRGDVVLVAQSYARWGLGVRISVESALLRIGTDHVDVLLLGWWPHPPSPSVLSAAEKLRKAGKVRFVALSTHTRPFGGDLLASPDGAVDVLHVRYNACHRGAEREVFARRRDGGMGVVAFTATRWGTLCAPRAGIERVPNAADCYRFVLSNPAVDLCMTGPRDGADIRAAIAALARGPMDEGELAWMRGVGDRVYADRKGGESFIMK